MMRSIYWPDIWFSNVNTTTTAKTYTIDRLTTFSGSAEIPWNKGVLLAGLRPSIIQVITQVEPFLLWKIGL